MRQTTAERLLAKTARTPGGCWVWTGAKKKTGYGWFGRGGRGGGSDFAHRVAYELFVGPIPEGLQIDHLCRNRACVNPAHLEPVTLKENLHRGETITAAHASRTHCPSGHAYDEANTYVRATGARQCRACARERASKRRAA